jgi:two-component system chemotaxis response regulator CheY
VKTAWLVDDDEEMATAVGLMFKLLGYSTRSFLNAPSAANALLGGLRPDLILLDINMPQVSGKDFLEFVRCRPEFSQLPVLMLSSEFADVQIAEFLKLGADGYVTKPVSLEELESAVDRALENRK